MTGNDILKAKDVAKYLHLHLFTVHNLARQGKLPAFKIGKDWRFRKVAIEEWVKAKENASADKIKGKPLA
jgi:excisionase family DNA binding protein